MQFCCRDTGVDYGLEVSVCVGPGVYCVKEYCSLLILQLIVFQLSYLEVLTQQLLNSAGITPYRVTICTAPETL